MPSAESIFHSPAKALLINTVYLGTWFARGSGETERQCLRQGYDMHVITSQHLSVHMLVLLVLALLQSTDYLQLLQIIYHLNKISHVTALRKNAVSRASHEQCFHLLR